MDRDKEQMEIVRRVSSILLVLGLFAHCPLAIVTRVTRRNAAVRHVDNS